MKEIYESACIKRQKIMICIRKEKYKRLRKRKERCMLREFLFPKCLTLSNDD